MAVQDVLAPIRPLPPLLVNQIAAGEVVERPASVVKELVENSLDAGASRILVELEQGGIELIRITDDGRGIPPDELALALAPHATSKIRDASDLDRVATMGFRGEALASITSVSRLTLRSRATDQTAAAELSAEGDSIGEVRPAAGPPGTCVTVRNLFFNTPARRKFLRTPQTEQGHCLDWLRDLALAWPAVAFEVRTDGRVALDVPPNQGPRERAIAIVGKELESQLLECHYDAFDDSRGLTLWGLVGLPSIARATNKAQHVFINGRAVRDKTIQHALREAYRGLIEPGRHPTAVLMLAMGPEAVDVNVHPAKLEVRFRDQSAVHSGVLRAVREALRRADLTPEFSPSRPAISYGERDAILPMPERPREPLPIAAARFVESFGRVAPAGPQARLDIGAIREALATPPAPAAPDAAPTSVSEASTPAGPVQAPPPPPLLQVHRSYVVTQDDEGIVIIDQHALHERVMFEALLARVSKEDLESQRLLMPAAIAAEAAHLALLPRLAGLFKRIGIAAEPLGPRAIGVFAFPSFLFERGVDPVEFVSALLDRAAAEDFAPDGEEAMREVLDMMACKAAVKAGDRLQTPELAALIDLREDVERSSNCPHGRPTSIRLSLRELERRFGRS